MSSLFLWLPFLVACSLSDSGSGVETPQKAGQPQTKCWSPGDEVENARHLSGTPPRLSEDLRNERVSRSVVAFRLCISEEGTVVRVLTTASSGNRRVDRFFEKELLRWRYEPRVVNGAKRPSVAFVTVTLALLPSDSS
jgi:hypothetical protein